MLYRGSTLGTTLTSALDELVAEEEIPSDLALKIKEQFDDVCLSPSQSPFLTLHRVSTKPSQKLE